MIPASAVKQFLKKPRDDHRWLKRLKHAELDELLSQLDPPPAPWPKLGLHQKVCLYLGIKFGSFAFWLDMGCVDGETEYLTPTGWSKIKDYEEGEVAQYDPYTRKASFVQPLAFVNRPCDKMYHFRTVRGCDQMVSPEHNMLVVGTELKGGVKATTKGAAWKHSPIEILDEYNSKGWYGRPCFYKTKPAEILNQSVRFETTFLMDGAGVDLTEEQLRVQVAVHADGYLYCKSKVAIRIKKQRKKERLRSLLWQAGIAFKEYDRGEGFISFCFVPPIHTKNYGLEWWRCSLIQKRIICDEVGHWDGSYSRSGAVSFFSRRKPCAEFIQFCFASTRRRAFLSRGKLRDGEVDYTVHAIGNGRSTNLANLRNGRLVDCPSGRKYCFEVPTGYLVLRRNGNIFITGNTGKTLVSLELLQYWWDLGLLRRALIFVTSDKAFSTWERQIKQYEIRIPYVTLDSNSSAGKWEQLDSLREGLVLLHYPGTVAMTTQFGKKKKGKKARLELVDEYVEHLLEGVDAVVFDESTRASNHRSLTHKLCAEAAGVARSSYALAGMPFGRDPTPLWAQHKLIDGGETLGPTLGIFREAFFSTEPNRYTSNEHIKKFTFRKAMQPQLSRVLQHRSITYEAKECIDVPKVRYIPEEIRLPQEARAYYKTVVTRIMEARGNLRAMKNAFLQMRQLSSGFLGFKDDETGEKAEIEFDENPKLDRLVELMEELPHGRKAVIFYEYTHSGRRITAELEEMGLNPVWLWSGTKKPRDALASFIERPKHEVAVINNRVGAFSLDGLQEVANYEVFYESPVSPIDRSQAEKRLVRQGQRRKVFIYDLIVKDTADAKILGFHREGESLFDALLRDPSRVLS